jgi:hypothetical protein
MGVDIKRLAASVVIAGYNNGFKKADVREAAARCVGSYREHIAAYAEMSVLERWYERLDAEDLIALVKSRKWKNRLQKQIAKESSRSVVEDDFPNLTRVEKGSVRIKDNPPLIFHQPGLRADEHVRLITNVFRRYRASLADDRRALIDHYEVRMSPSRSSASAVSARVVDCPHAC